MFKKSRSVYPDEFWAEVVASRLSSLTGVPVPPAYAAYDSRTGESGALIEWFYGYPDTPHHIHIAGGQFMKASIPAFDHKRGTQHNFQTIETWCDLLSRPDLAEPKGMHLAFDWQRAWSLTLTFDALIGNTDRHQENWGFIRREANGSQPKLVSISPAFDNGSSLGIEHIPENLGRFLGPTDLQKYIDRGRHHMKWRLNDPGRPGHVELLTRIIGKYPHTRATMYSVVNFQPAELDSVVLPLTELQLPSPLSRERADFMLRLLRARQANLLQVLAP